MIYQYKNKRYFRQYALQKSKAKKIFILGIDGNKAIRIASLEDEGEANTLLGILREEAALFFELLDNVGRVYNTTKARMHGSYKGKLESTEVFSHALGFFQKQLKSREEMLTKYWTEQNK